jgi:hypothetical protein
MGREPFVRSLGQGDATSLADLSGHGWSGLWPSREGGGDGQLSQGLRNPHTRGRRN